jgi:Leucine-rich repeat (LRR) protein
MDGDGKVSQSEVLRLLYYATMGPYWGSKFQSWCDLKVNECTLPGIACFDGRVTKIDLTEANLCSDGNGEEGVAEACIGLPAELMYLSDSLEVLSLPHRHFLRGTLPSEIGELTKLQSLDLHGCELLSGTIPSELGNLSSLTFMDMSGCSLRGPIPTELFRLAKLQKLSLGGNAFEGGLPNEIGNLESVKEIRITGAYLSGTLPTSLGDLPELLNLQLYGNSFTGTIPEELGKSTTLQKIGEPSVAQGIFRSSTSTNSFIFPRSA